MQAINANDSHRRESIENGVDASEAVGTLLLDTKSQCPGARVLHGICDGVLVLDDKLTVIELSRQVEQFLGRPAEDAVGKYVFDVFPEGKGAIFEQSCIKALREQKPISFESRLDIESDATWCNIRVYPDHGALTLYIRLSTDERPSQDSLFGESAVNRAQAALSRALISSQPADSISRLVLGHAKRLTDSPTGFACYANHLGGQFRFPELSELSHETDCVDVTQLGVGLLAMEDWAKKSTSTLRVNDPSDLPIRPGSPEDHHTFSRLLAVPALANGVLLGQIVVAGANRDYTDHDQAVLEQLAELYALAIQRHHMEQRLSESEERYRLLVAHAPTSVAISTLDGRLLACNEMTTRISGYSQSELRQNNQISAYVNPADREKLLQLVITTGEVRGFETEMVRKNGEHYTASLNARLVPYQGEDVLLVHAEDISERRKAFDALQESEERFANFMSHLPAAAFLVDEAGKVIYVNQHMKTELGAEHWIGQSTTDIVPASAAERMLTDNRRALRDGRVSRTESLIDAQGTVRLYRTVKFPVQTRDGTTLIGGVSLDVTEQIRVRAALEEEHRFFADVVATAPFVICRLTPEGVITFLNPVGEQISGYRLDQIVGKFWAETFSVITPQSTSERRMQRLRTEDLQDVETILADQDGTERIIVWNTLRRMDIDESLTEIICFGHDVTTQRRMAQELETARSLESTGILADGLARRLNDLLVGVMGNVSLARMRADGLIDIEDLLVGAESASESVHDLTQQLLMLSPRQQPSRKPTFITDLLMDAATFALRDSNTWCQFEIADDLWPANIDARQISQAIQNLVNGARRAMPDGGRIQIRADNVKSPTPGGVPLRPGPYLRVSVHDEGSKIEREALFRAFEPDSTAGEGRIDQELAVSYALVRGNGGHIALESGSGLGNLYSVYLPAHPKGIDLKPASLHGSTQTLGRILILDREPIVLETVDNMLHQLGYEAVAVQQVEGAISQCASATEAGDPFELLILDASAMQAWKENDVTQALRQVHPGLKIVVSSSAHYSPVMRHCTELGFQDTLGKPYNMEDLRTVVQRVIAIEDEG